MTVLDPASEEGRRRLEDMRRFQAEYDAQHANGRVNGTTATAAAPAPPARGTPAERLAAATSTLGALTARYGTAVDPLAAPYVNRAELTEVVGAQESFKSWFVADLARAVHTGGLWLGSIEVPQGGVLYVEQERARNLAYQMALLAAGWGQDLRGIATVEPCGLDLSHPEWQDAVIERVERERPLLVVINSYRAVFRGKPPDSSDVAYALGWLGQLAERVHCAVCLVDGTNKGGSVGRLRGTEAHGDSVQKAFEADTILHVERKRDELGRGVGPARVYLGKQRYGQGTPPAPFVFDVVPFLRGQPFSSSSLIPRDRDDDEKPDGVRALWLAETVVDRDEAAARPPNAVERVRQALPDDGSTRSVQELATAAGLTHGAAANALSQLRAAGEVENAERGHWRRTAEGVR